MWYALCFLAGGVVGAAGMLAALLLGVLYPGKKRP
jgi:hypothetical protein